MDRMACIDLPAFPLQLLLQKQLDWRAHPVAVVDSADNRALVTDDGLQAVVAVDLTTGARTIFSDNSDAVPTPANPFIDPEGVAVDRATGRVFVSDRGRASVMVLDIDSGERMIQSH